MAGAELGEVLVTRIAWTIRNGKIPKGLHVLHHCDNPSCFEISHLYLGTNVNNVFDRVMRGRSARNIGEKNGNASLSFAEVEEIRADRRYQYIIAAEYGISQAQVSIIQRGKNWPSVHRQVPRHQTFIRQLPCLSCLKPAPSDCTHVRKGTNGGMGIKPDSRFTLPLCTKCHRRQHRTGELSFWSALRIDPINIALALWTRSGDLPAGQRIVFRARQAIDLIGVPRR